MIRVKKGISLFCTGWLYNLEQLSKLKKEEELNSYQS